MARSGLTAAIIAHCLASTRTSDAHHPKMGTRRTKVASHRRLISPSHRPQCRPGAVGRHDRDGKGDAPIFLNVSGPQGTFIGCFGGLKQPGLEALAQLLSLLVLFQYLGELARSV